MRRQACIRWTCCWAFIFPQVVVSFDAITNQKRSDVEHSVDALRRRFGYFSVQRAVLMAADPRLIIDAAGQHTVHPHSFM